MNVIGGVAYPWGSLSLYFILLINLLISAPASATSLDDQLAAFKKADQQTESAVANLLKTGLDEKRAAEALAVVKPWLDANPVTSQTAQVYAGLSLQYAGEWADAVIFYRKFLKNKAVEPKLAGLVVPATYRLLISDMRQPESAYLLMREEGDRLRVYGNASQFDAWFLAEAMRRNDVPAVCKRLGALFSSAPGNVTPDTAALEWVCQKLESFRFEEESWYEAALKLAEGPRIPAVYKARIAWATVVVPYNSKVTELVRARKEVPDALSVKPLQAAAALVAADPYGGSMLAARGWMGFNEGDTPTFLRHLAPQREAKAAQLLKALRTLPPDKATAVLSLQVAEARGRRMTLLFSAEEMRDLVKSLPSVFNVLSAPDVPMYDKELTPADAKALAPHLARNPHGSAALVRAYAVAGTNTLSAMAPAIMKSEMWRFDAAKTAIDLVWNSGAKRDGDHAALCKQYEKLGARHEELKRQVAKGASSKERLAAFTLLQKDLLAAAPSVPGARLLWDELFAQAPEEDQGTMLKTLAANVQGDREVLLLLALAKSRAGGHAFYLDPLWGDNFMMNGPQRARYYAGAAPLVAELRRILSAQAQAGAISERLFGAWMHAADPQDAAARTFMKDLAASPAYAKMNPAYRRVAADENHFGYLAKLPSMAATEPSVISRELLALPDGAPPAQVEAALKTVITRAGQAPEPLAVFGLHKVAELPSLTGETRVRALSLFNQLSPLGDYPGGEGYGELIARLLREMQEAKQWGEVAPYVSAFWRGIEADDSDRARYARAEAFVAFAEEALTAGAPSVALAIAKMGLHHPLRCLDPKDTRSGGQQRVGRLRQAASKAAVAMGAVEIPVDETHPAYPLYKSNAEFVRGNLDSAWSLYKANEEQLKPQAEQADGEGPSLLRKLSVEYSFWLLRRNIEAGRAEQAELLIKELTIWSRDAEGTFSLEQEAELKIAYADLAFIKGALPTARAWYRKVADAREYKDSEMHVRAALGSVKVDRVSKNFGAALEELDKLMRIEDPSARTRAHYARAEVLMDQENYKDAFDEIDAVLRGVPNHADALILRGKIQYQMRKLVEASEIELGVSQEDKVMVPGEVLKINLNDPTLSVSGVGADIEVEVWAKSGDREIILLHQLGDSKDKFRADVTTALAPPVAGDKVLQVLGVDEIRYGYSKQFRAKMKDLPPDPQTAIGIASDAHLSMSAGAFPPRAGERRLDLDELGLSTAQKALGMRAVRPGNPVYIRVIDPDQSKTAGNDTVAVTLQASSGDEIRRLLLKETGPYTGEFEAIVPTACAQALAFASERAPGRDPNMAISSKPYPGWLGNVGDKEKARTFGVDLNDNVALDKMALRFDGPENALTHFVLQTSMNGRDWQTRSRYPEEGAPCDGRPRVTSFPTYREGLEISTLIGWELPADWQEKMELTSVRASCRYLSAAVPQFSAGNLPVVEAGHPGYSVLLKLRAYFYQPAAAIRRFRLAGYPATDGKGTRLTVFLLDGQPADASEEDPLTIERELAPGLHTIELWHHASWTDQRKAKPQLLMDVPGQQALVPCPDSLFDPATFPEGVRAHLPQPATITKAADGGGLEIAFGSQTKARLVRLVILGFEGVAPSIKAVTLTERDGTARLPVKEDFMALNQNSQLEVLPGDEITVRYDDEVTATPKRNKHEQRLQVAYNTATLSASFLRYETTAEGRKLQLEPIRRFNLNDAVAIVIDDADMDSTPKPDTVDCTVVSSDGTSIKLQALETEEHSGQFIGRVFPVKGAPTRDSEIQVTPGATLTATYRDMENLDPGIPADRTVTIEHAQYVTPQLGVYQVSSEPLQPEAHRKEAKAVEPKKRSTRVVGPEVVTPRQVLNYAYVEEAALPSTPLKSVIGASLRFDVVIPHLALAASSELSAYVQVRPQAPSGGKAGGTAVAGQPFDVSVPGTLKLIARPSGTGAEVPGGYKLGAEPQPPTNKPPLDEGRFSFSVPLILGDRPTRSFATKDAEALPSSAIPDGVVVQAGDVVQIGFAYKDEKDQVQWKTASFTVGSHAFLDVMNSSYNEILDCAFVGEKIFVRVIAPGLDRGPERDSAAVSLKATSGAAATFQLRETEAHTGVFKGVFSISYADQELPPELPPVELNGFPVRYGDEVVVGYEAAGETPAQAMAVSVNKGADGLIEPFSKRFTGDEMAVKTGFTLAECWFELAKKHRTMDQESLARREMEHAQKLLAEAIATHRDDEMRAHAEYLLGNLSQEYADLAKNDEAKLPMYQEALARFSKIPVDYPDTEFAPKAQFKTALLYEKMGETEIAVEEYVKLAYKYPKCEYIPEVMSRLGGYFQSKGQAFKEKADPLREKTDMASKAEVLRLDELSYPEFLRAALIFGKLQERFPDHELAGLAGLRSAQNYMRMHQYEKAIAGFKIVVDNETYDGLEIRAQALYWSGLSHERWVGIMAEGNYKARGSSLQAAYQTYRRVTFDFPESKWAKMARGRLADAAFARIIELEEKERERMLETLKFEAKRKK